MKEIDPLHQDNTRDEQKQHRQVSKGAWRIPRGMFVWMIDPATEKPEVVKPSMVRPMEQVIGEKRSGATVTVKQTALKVEVNPDFYYVKAINPKNALRKYYKSQFYAAYRRRNQPSGNSPQSGNQ
jgi:hypothetical protein